MLHCVAAAWLATCVCVCVIVRWAARCAYAAISVIFLCINVTCAALGERGSSGEKGKRTWKLVLVRVIVNDLLFIMEAVMLAATLLLLTRQPRSFSPYLMSKVQTPVCLSICLSIHPSSIHPFINPRVRPSI